MQTDNKFLIPLAVIIAGVLIGGAVYFKDRTPSQPADGVPQDIDIAPLSADDHVLGNPNAKIVMIEFSDIDCPFCQTFDATMRRIMDTYGKDGDLAWAYRHFPLDQLHPDARLKAESTECVAALGGNTAFWSYLDILFTRSDETVAELGDIAASVGVDKAAFETCVAAGTYKQDVADDVLSATTAGARGTPYTVIITPDGSEIPLNGALPYEMVAQTIEAILADTQAAQ